MTDIQFLFDAAVNFHQKGNLQRASELYDRVRFINPAHVMTLNNQALIARALGRYEIALEMLSKAQRLEPDNFEILANLGRVKLQNDQPGEAELYLREAIAKRPEDINLGINLGMALQRQGKYREARATLTGFLDREVKNFNLLHTLGLVALAEEKYQQAKDYFNAALGMRPQDPDTLEQLENLEALLGKVERTGN